VGNFDFVGLVETWLDEKGWDRIKGSLPRSHDWYCEAAKKEKKKGRAKEGMVIGKKKGWGEGEMELVKGEGGGVWMSTIREGRERWRLITVYNGGEWRELEKKLEESLGEREEIEESTVIVGGDFNIRTGELGGSFEEGEGRKSKDKTIGNSGRRLIEWAQGKGWYILNGRRKGDWLGEYTYVGARGSTVIDYIFVNERAHDRLIDFKVDCKTDSDHMPLCARIRKKEEDTEEDVGERSANERGYREIEKITWSKEAIKKYREMTETLEQERESEKWSVEERWAWIKGVVERAMVKKRFKLRKRKIGFKD